MSEFFYDPSEAAAAQPASAEQQDALARLARCIENYPGKFGSTGLPANYTYEAWQNIGRAKLTIGCGDYRVELNIDEPIVGTDNGEESYNAPSLIKRSEYTFIRSMLRDRYKFSDVDAREWYYWPHNDGKMSRAFPADRYHDSSPIWSPVKYAKDRQNGRRAEHMWHIGVLSAGRCAELVQLMQSFDPEVAQGVKRRHHAA